MPTLTPQQRQRKQQVESVLRVAAPLLDLMLAFGERLSRLVEPDDPEYYPPRESRPRS